MMSDPDPVYMVGVRAYLDEVEAQRAAIQKAIEAEAGG